MPPPAARRCGRAVRRTSAARGRRSSARWPATPVAAHRTPRLDRPVPSRRAWSWCGPGAGGRLHERAAVTTGAALDAAKEAREDRRKLRLDVREGKVLLVQQRLAALAVP